MLFEASHRSRSAPAFCGGPHRKIAATGTKVDQKSFPGKPREESGKLLGKLQFSLPPEARDRQDLGERDQERGKKSRLCEAFILNCKLDGNGIFPSLTRTRGASTQVTPSACLLVRHCLACRYVECARVRKDAYYLLVLAQIVDQLWEHVQRLCFFSLRARPPQWARVSRPSSVSYADILFPSPYH